MSYRKVRVIAFYLPQYHPIPENNEWWGKGFTEWTNVAKAKPLFRGHYQPKIPRDLGFYDLRLPDIKEEQAKLAREAGIEGFAYWHYWFGNGKRLLERPFNEVLNSGKPDFPFCLAWANHSWSNKTWKKEFSKKQGKVVIQEQLYPGIQDYTDHFYSVLDAFRDSRYITVDGKPLFFIFDPKFKDISVFIETWRDLAIKNGLKGIHFVGQYFKQREKKYKSYSSKTSTTDTTNSELAPYFSKGLDAINLHGNIKAEFIRKGYFRKMVNYVLTNFTPLHVYDIYDQQKINDRIFGKEDSLDNVYPTILPNWDRTARFGNQAAIYINSTPEVFKEHIEDALRLVKHKTSQHKIIFLKSWNEWGEGNYVEPCLKYGKGYLNALRDTLKQE
ncbi:MAG: glycoside hydrolase family 99-like domain-containing protein [Mariniphaga sp.]|nr:glycoside hydrolase family 99-like domain-containing protein [Mariniphaga sp.]